VALTQIELRLESNRTRVGPVIGEQRESLMTLVLSGRHGIFPAGANFLLHVMARSHPKGRNEVEHAKR